MRIATLAAPLLLTALVGIGANTPALADAPGDIAGTVTNSSGTPLEEIDVTGWTLTDGTWVQVAWTETDEDGDYDLDGLVAGAYRIRIDDAFSDYVTEWWDDAATVETARDIPVAAGQSSPDRDAVLVPETDTIVNLVAPRILGTPTYGSTLTAAPGTWSPGSVSLTYEWSVRGQPALRDTGPTYKLQAPERGNPDITVELEVTATSGDLDPVGVYAESVDVDASLSVLTKPTVKGVAARGRTLTARPGRVTLPATTTYQWLRGSRPIRGATRPTYRPTASDVGQRLRVRITYKRSDVPALTVKTKPTQRVRG